MYFQSLLLSACVFGHGRLTAPAPVSNAVTRVSNTAPCGPGGATGGQTTNLQAGQATQMTWLIRNGDGAGPVTVSLASTPGSTNFNTPLQVQGAQVPGNNGNGGKRGSSNNFMVMIPAGTTCQGCLIQVRQPNGFGSCAMVNIQ